MVHHIIPVISTILYFNFPQNIIINRETLNDVSLIHNIMLSCFSFYIFVELGSFIIEKGIVIENGYYFSFSQFDQSYNNFFVFCKTTEANKRLFYTIFQSILGKRKLDKLENSIDDSEVVNTKKPRRNTPSNNNKMDVVTDDNDNPVIGSGKKSKKTRTKTKKGKNGKKSKNSRKNRK